MILVVDTSIIFSALLRSGKQFREILFSKDNEFYSCKYAITEIFKHKEKIVKCSKLSEEIVLETFHRILKNIHFVNDDLISHENLLTAYYLCHDVDEKDTVFIALTLELAGVLWTGDKELKEGLQKKGFNKFFEKGF